MTWLVNYRKMDSRAFSQDLELNTPNLLNFTLSQLNVRKRVMWFVHFCQHLACLQEAKRQIGVQMSLVDQQIRSIRYRLHWSDVCDRSLMLQLRNWLKERRFYQELTYAILNSVAVAFHRRGHDLYPDGIRPIEDWNWNKLTPIPN